MPYPVTREQLEEQIRRQYNYQPGEARTIVNAYLAKGVIRFDGPALTLLNPTTQDAHLVAGLANDAQGRSLGSAGRYKIKEALDHILREAPLLGSGIS